MAETEKPRENDQAGDRFVAPKPSGDEVFVGQSRLAQAHRLASQRDEEG